MYANSSKSQAAARRSQERRKVEDDAPRLAAEIPALRTARIQVVEHVPTGSNRYVKHVVVARAPALFILSCGDPSCQEGGYDITRTLMNAFRRQLASCEGTDTCCGMSGSAQCGRSITYQLSAEYAAPTP
jgi:hypothetical protein